MTAGHPKTDFKLSKPVKKSNIITHQAETVKINCKQQLKIIRRHKDLPNIVHNFMKLKF